MDDEISSIDSQQANNSRVVVAVAISVVLTALIVGSGVYMWQQAAHQKEIALLQSQIAILPTPSPITSPSVSPIQEYVAQPGDTWIQPSFPSGYDLEDTVRVLDTVKVGDVIQGMTVSKIEPWSKDPKVKFITFSGEKVVSAQCASYPFNSENPYNPDAHATCVGAPIPFASLNWNSASSGRLTFSNDKVARQMFSPVNSDWNATIRILGLEVSYPVIEGVSAKTELLEVINKTLSLSSSTSGWKMYTDSNDNYSIQHPSARIATESFYNFEKTTEGCTKITLEEGFVMIHNQSAASTCQTKDLLNIAGTKVQQSVTVEGKTYTAQGITVRNPQDSDFNYYQFTVGKNMISFGVMTTHGQLSEQQISTQLDTLIQIVESYTAK